MDLKAPINRTQEQVDCLLSCRYEIQEIGYLAGDRIPDGHDQERLPVTVFGHHLESRNRFHASNAMQNLCCYRLFSGATDSYRGEGFLRAGFIFFLPSDS